MIVSTRLSETPSPRRREIQLPIDPVVWTSGASGPAGPPDAIPSRDTGIRDRRSVMSDRAPVTWMLSTSSSTSPGLPNVSVSRPISAPMPVRTARSIGWVNWDGPSTWLNPRIAST